jgi:NAD(P)-dependent dehydrogenase (short-subunit alcohol dehydrogenase family)
MSDMRFTNKIIVITGASSGIGAATAQLFAQEGARVYNMDNAKPQYVCANVHWLQSDVTDFAALQRAVASVMEREKRIDYLFANAGIYCEAPLTEMAAGAVSDIIETNLVGTIYILQLILPIMQKQRRGNIVLMGSDQSFIGRKNSTVYGATKGAIAQLTKGVAVEYAADNIRVNCVCPGAIDTPMMEQAATAEAMKDAISAADIYEKIRQTIPLKRIGRAADVATCVAFLCSDESSFVTGALLSIDGGVVAA